MADLLRFGEGVRPELASFYVYTRSLSLLCSAVLVGKTGFRGMPWRRCPGCVVRPPLRENENKSVLRVRGRALRQPVLRLS